MNTIKKTPLLGVFFIVELRARLKEEVFYRESAMNTSHLLRAIALLLGALFISSLVLAAGKKPTDKERKERANAEYVRCTAISKKGGVSAMLAYVKNSQKGTPLKSSPEKLAQENCVADGFGLARYQDIEEIVADDGVRLVPVSSSLILIKDDVPQARHVARPWTRDYLIEVASYLDQTPGMKKVAHSDAQILVASLIRSRTDQDAISKVTKAYRYIKGKLRKLLGGRRSFADCSSDAVCSTHLTGATVDISLLGVDRKKRKLLAERLLEDREEGRILAILESAGNHFHVFVIPPQPAGPAQLLVTPAADPNVHEVHTKTPAS